MTDQTYFKLVHLNQVLCQIDRIKRCYCNSAVKARSCFGQILKTSTKVEAAKELAKCADEQKGWAGLWSGERTAVVNFIITFIDFSDLHKLFFLPKTNKKKLLVINLVTFLYCVVGEFYGDNISQFTCTPAASWTEQRGLPWVVS